MGTNFYLHGWEYNEDNNEYIKLDYRSFRDDSPITHIGKRSAAGLYCWDCNETLIIGGFSAVHSGSGTLSSCPKCGKEKDSIQEPLKSGAVAVELGFAKPNTERPVGVRSCSSFTWAQPELTFMEFARKNLARAIVISEYEAVMSGNEFLIMLNNNCPICFYNMIGKSFC